MPDVRVMTVELATFVVISQSSVVQGEKRNAVQRGAV